MCDMTVFGLLLAMLGPLAIAVTSETPLGSPNRLRVFLFAQAGLAGVVAVVLFLVLVWERNSLSSLGLRSVNVRCIAWGLALAAFLLYVLPPIETRVLRVLRLGGFEKGLAKLRELPVWSVALAIVLGGAAEEILYRGYAVERIGTLTGNLWFAGVISVIVFSAAHIPMWGWRSAVATLMPGAVVTGFYLWRRDLTACIFAHVVTDFMGILISPPVSPCR